MLKVKEWLRERKGVGQYFVGMTKEEALKQYKEKFDEVIKQMQEEQPKKEK
jgi:hypothetical protein